MKKFKFTLKSLLDLKQAVERQHKSELGAALAAQNRFVQELEVMDQELLRQRLELSRPADAVSPGELALRDIGFRALFQHMDEQKEKIRVAKLECERIRHKLTVVMSERKVLERLKEKQLALYKEEVSRQESIAIDEFLSNKLVVATAR